MEEVGRSRSDSGHSAKAVGRGVWNRPGFAALLCIVKQILL